MIAAGGNELLETLWYLVLVFGGMFAIGGVAYLAAGLVFGFGDPPNDQDFPRSV